MIVTGARDHCSQSRLQTTSYQIYNIKARLDILCFLDLFLADALGHINSIGSLNEINYKKELNPRIFRKYQLERFDAGTTVCRWKCPHPPEILNLMAGGG